MEQRPHGSSYGRAGARWMVDPEAVWRPGSPVPTGTPGYAVLITDAGEDAGAPLIVAADEGFGGLTGYAHGEVAGRPRAWLDGPETDTARLRTAFERLAAAQPDAGVTVQYRRDGRPFGASWAAESVRVAPHRPALWVWVLYEIALERVAAEGDAAAPARPALLVARAAGVDDARVLDANAAFAELTGYPRAELLGRPPGALRHPPAGDGERLRLQRALLDGHRCRAELLDYTRAGRPFWNRLDLLPLGDGGEDGAVERPARDWLGIAEDVTERKDRERRTWEAAYYDDLTGLPNRALAQVRMEQAIRAAHRNRDRVGFLYIDLEGVPGSASRRSRRARNQALQLLATRLADAARTADTLAYVGGHEFVLVAEDLGAAEAGGVIAERLCRAARGPLALPGGDGETMASLDVGATIGMSVFPDHGGDAEQLLQRADAALIEARRRGRAWAVYCAGRAAARIDAAFVGRELSPAVARDEFAVALQPIVDLADGATCGHEALGRWHHPGEGWIPPSVFLPAAAECDRLDTIGAHVQALAFAATASWREVLRERPPRIAINLAAGEIEAGAVDRRLLARLAAAGLGPAALELDLAAPLVPTLGDAAVAALGRLRAEGVRIALDDCRAPGDVTAATGRVALDRVKIDLALVRDVPLDHERQALLRQVLAAARGHGLAVTAEGVETAEEAEYLARAGCDEAQGHFFGRPEVI